MSDAKITDTTKKGRLFCRAAPNHPIGRKLFLLNERKFHDLGLHQLLADHDGDLRADLGELLLHVTHTNPLFQTGRHRTRSHLADDIALRRGDLVTMTRNTAIDHLETDQFAGQTAGLLLFHQFAVDELLAIDELGQPVQARLDRRSRIVDIITVEAETHLQTQRVAGTEADIFSPSFEPSCQRAFQSFSPSSLAT